MMPSGVLAVLAFALVLAPERAAGMEPGIGRSGSMHRRPQAGLEPSAASLPSSETGRASAVTRTWPAQEGQLDLLVLDHEGAPVERCDLVVVDSRRSMHEATTDASGRTRLDGVAHGRLDIAIGATGGVVIEDADLERPLVVWLSAPTIVTGWVRTRWGEPLAYTSVLIKRRIVARRLDASERAYGRKRFDAPAHERDHLVGLTHPDGSFSLEVHDDACRTSMMACAEERGGRRSGLVPLVTNGAPLELVIDDRLARLDLKLHGLPHPPAGLVTLRALEGNREVGPTRRESIVGLGPIVIDDLAPGHYRLAVRATGCAPIVDQVSIAGIETVTREFALEAGGSVEGFVSLAGRGEGGGVGPARGAAVAWRTSPPIPGLGGRATADVDGRYRFDDVAPGVVEIVACWRLATSPAAHRAKADDRDLPDVFLGRRIELGSFAERLTTVEVVADGTVRADVALPELLVVEGKCLDHEGAGCSDLVIEAWSLREPHRVVAAAAIEASGRFVLRLAPEAHVVRVCEGPSGKPIHRRPWMPSDELDLVVPREARTTARVVGRLVDPAGNALGGNLELRREADPEALVFRRAEEAEDGRFAFPRLAGGRHRLTLLAHARRIELLAPIDVPHAQTVDVGDVTCDLRRARIEVELTTPILGLEPVWLRLEPEQDEDEARVLVRGREGNVFSFTEVLPGAHTLLIAGALSPRVIPVTLAPGEDAKLSVAVSEGVPCKLRWRDTDRESTRYALRVFGPDSPTVPVVSRSIHGGHTSPRRGDEIRTEARLGFGLHRIELVASDGRTARALVEIEPDDVARDVPLELR